MPRIVLPRLGPASTGRGGAADSARTGAQRRPAEHIAQRSLTGVGAEMTAVSRGIIQRMSEVAIGMRTQAAKAYTEGTVHFDELDEADDEMDVLHERLSNDVTGGAMDAAVGAQVTLLAGLYERLGDHAVNLARRIDGLPK